MEVRLLLEKPSHHVLEIVDHDTAKVVKLGKKDVVQCLTVLSYVFCLLSLVEGEIDTTFKL